MRIEDGQADAIQISPEMIEAGVFVWRAWEDSEEPDVRLMVKALLVAAYDTCEASSTPKNSLSNR